VNRVEKDREHLVVNGEDYRGLVKCPYLFMMEWTVLKRTQIASLWTVRMTVDWWSVPTCPWWSGRSGVERRAPCCERWGWHRIGEVSLPVHDGVNRAEKNGERLVVEGEDDRSLGEVLQVAVRGLTPLVPSK
jgi:hypothetical protein